MQIATIGDRRLPRASEVRAGNQGGDEEMGSASIRISADGKYSVRLRNQTYQASTLVEAQGIARRHGATGFVYEVSR